MARRKYPIPPKPPKFDKKLIKEKFTYGDTKFALTEKCILMYSTLTNDWRPLYRNKLEERWNSITNL